MSLLDEIVQDHEDDPGSFLWSGYTVLENEIIDERRWYNRRRAVLIRVGEGDEYVTVEYNEGNSELQEDTDYVAEFYEVRPVPVTVTKFERV